MVVGLLEAFELIEQHGRDAHKADIVSTDEILFVSDAKKRKGCRSVKSTLSSEERMNVIEIGKRIKKWRKER
jgi:hypothetical protein